MVGPLLDMGVRKDEGVSQVMLERADMAEDLLNLATTYLKELDEDKDGKSDTLTNGILWVTSFMESIKLKGDESLVNSPMLANMGKLSLKMRKWFGWSDDLFRRIRKSNEAGKMGFRMKKVKGWIETQKRPEALIYYQEMTGLKLSKSSRDIIKNSVPRDSSLIEIDSFVIDEEIEIYDDSALFAMDACDLEGFLLDDNKYRDLEHNKEWDQNSMWTETLQSFVSDPSDSDAEMEAETTVIQPPMTRNLVDRLNVLHEVSGSLRCVAITTDNRPCPSNRMKNSLYCACHQELGSVFSKDIVKQIMDPDLIEEKYQFFRGVFVKTPSSNPQILSRRMKASLEGPIWEFESQMNVMEHLLRMLFNAGLERTPQDRRDDVIPERKLIEEFGRLKYSTYTQLYRSTREKLTLLGLDINKRWTKFTPFLRLHLGSHFGFMNPTESMGNDEVDFMEKNYIPTHSKWSGVMDEERIWNKNDVIGKMIPVLNHKTNHNGETVPCRLKDGQRRAIMQANPMFRYVISVKWLKKLFFKFLRSSKFNNTSIKMN